MKVTDSNAGSISGMSGGGENLGDKTGFVTSGYRHSKGTPQGEGAMFNYLPPGMDIFNQECADLSHEQNMPLKKVVSESYPGDGW